VPIDVTFSELFEVSDQVHLEMVVYVRLATPIEGEIPGLIDASVNLRQFIGEAFGFYRFAQGSGENPWTLEALGGIRIWATWRCAWARAGFPARATGRST